MEKKLAVQDLFMRFGDKTVLDHLSFDVQKGEFLSLLGPSGCGKTTILRILVGLQAPTSGKIFKDGQEITGLAPDKRGMGIVFQNYALFQNMTVLGNVEYALKLRKDLKPRSREIALQLIEQVGLTEHKDKKPGRLSGGQQQRVAIARTLALNPDILLFDEPMSALDVANRLTLRDEIKRIQREYHSTILYITHDQEEAFALSDRIMVMGNGRIHQLDTPQNIIDHPADEYVEEFVIRNLNKKIESLMKYRNPE